VPSGHGPLAGLPSGTTASRTTRRSALHYNRSVRAALFGLIFVAFAASPPSSLNITTLEAIHAQRVQWKIKRAPFFEPEGVYRDFRAVMLASPTDPGPLAAAAREAEVSIVIGAGAGKADFRSGVLFIERQDLNGLDISALGESKAPDWQKLAAKFFKQFPDEVLGSRTSAQPEELARWDRELQTRELPAYGITTLAPDVKGSLTAALRATSTHVLARELKESEVRASLESGHAYVAHDWLCDPTGFTFSASNYFGGFEMGDTVVANPLFGDTVITARVPVPAKLRLYRNGSLVAEAHDT